MNRLRTAALIATDDDFLRLALRGILIDQLGFSEVLETRTLDEATQTLASHDDVRFALFDLNMPGLNTFAGIRTTREAFPDVRVAVVSASSNRYDVLRALEAGAHGFMPKGEGVRQLGLAIRMICDGNIYVPAFLTNIRNASNESYDLYPPRSAEHAAELEKITPRQQDVLSHLVKGMSNKEIARALFLSESAVKFHVGSLCSRLRVKNRTEIAARVSRMLPMSNGMAVSGEASTSSSFPSTSRQPRATPEAVIASLCVEAARAGRHAARRAP